MQSCLKKLLISAFALFFVVGGFTASVASSANELDGQENGWLLSKREASRWEMVAARVDCKNSASTRKKSASYPRRRLRPGGWVPPSPLKSKGPSPQPRRPPPTTP